jgi:hypothetical protein
MFTKYKNPSFTKYKNPSFIKYKNLYFINEEFLYFIDEEFLYFIDEGFLNFINEGFLYFNKPCPFIMNSFVKSLLNVILRGSSTPSCLLNTISRNVPSGDNLCMSSAPHMYTVPCTDKAVVTLPGENSIQFINTTNNTKDNKIKIEEWCGGVTAVKDKIYIGGDNKVIILNIDGYPQPVLLGILICRIYI